MDPSYWQTVGYGVDFPFENYEWTADFMRRYKGKVMDEPEISLHPSIVRAARKAIYAQSEVAVWQVMCTTHSAVFIDVTQSHPILIRVSSA